LPNAYLTSVNTLSSNVGAAISPGTATTSTYSAKARISGKISTGIVTFVAIGGKSSDTAHTPAIEQCQDGTVLSQAFLSPCKVLPP
jgi:hypothetical protein